MFLLIEICGATIPAKKSNVKIIVDANFNDGYSRMGSYMIIASRHVGGRFSLKK
nr:MAG TPA: hypothetical protein [Caudoviricetes sp.]